MTRSILSVLLFVVKPADYITLYALFHFEDKIILPIQTYFLPVIGLVEPKDLTPGDLVVSLAYSMYTCTCTCMSITQIVIFSAPMPRSSGGLMVKASN